MAEIPLMISLCLLFTGGPAPDDSWKERAADRLAAATEAPSAKTVADALDAAYRADDLELTRQAIKLTEDLKDVDRLRGLLLRALWRLGKLQAVEKMLADVTPASRDLDALTVAVAAALSRCDFKTADAYADAIAKIGPRTALQANALFSARLASDQHEGVAASVRRIEKLIDRKNGYPDSLLGESVDGLAEFFEKIGDEPLNRISRYGAAEMPFAAMLGVPRVDVMINGQGPYSLLLDTGGSVVLSLSPRVAEECGVKSLANASVRGVGGTSESGQAVVERLEIGAIELRRVMTRIYKLPSGLDQMIDGIVGTGMFARGRMTLNFADAVLKIEPSSEKPAAGSEFPVRIIGDGKIIAPVQVEGEPVLAIVDSGAGANALSPSRLRIIFPDRDTKLMEVHAMGVGESATKLNLGPSASLTGFGRTFKEFSGVGLDVLDSMLSPALGIQADAIVGMPMLRQMKTFTIDYHHARLWIDWPELH